MFTQIFAQARIILGVVLVLLLAVAFIWTYRAGYAAAEQKHKNDTLEQVSKELAVANAQWQTERDAMQKDIRTQKEYIDKITEVQHAVPKVSTPSCVDLGRDWMRVHNEAAGSVRSAMASH